MAITLKPGTVVQLKSGGPKMTVVGESGGFGSGGDVICEWFDEKNKSQKGTFSETSLEVTEKKTFGSGTINRA